MSSSSSPFSRKQLWRRAPSRVNPFSVYTYLSDLEPATTSPKSRSLSDGAVSTRSSIRNAPRRYNSAKDVSDDTNLNDNSNRKQNSVKIDRVVKVCLIASRKDFRDAGLASKLWYLEEDFTSFKLDAKREKREREREALKACRVSELEEIENSFANQEVDIEISDFLTDATVEPDKLQASSDIIGIGPRRKSFHSLAPESDDNDEVDVFSFMQVDSDGCRSSSPDSPEKLTGHRFSYSTSEISVVVSQN